MKTTIYTSQHQRSNLLFSLSEIFKELKRSRFVFWHLFKRDFESQYRQKLLGYFWIVASPLLSILPFVFLNRFGLFNPGETSLPYPVFLILGLGIWGFLISAFTVVSTGLQNNQDLVLRTNIPRITFAVTGLATVCFNLLVHFGTVFFVLLIFGIPIHPNLIFYPILILPIILFGVGLGLMFSVMGTVAKDISTFVLSGLNLLMFLTPVVYRPVFGNQILNQILSLNPFTYLVSVPRHYAATGLFTDLFQYSISLLLALVVLAFGIHSFYLINDKVTERL
ncbi:ABC transporter permease [Synechococcus sp. Cu2B8-bc1011]|uniref:ABC transporter permease n=1 Tax=Synechococcus sp. Cu2B8-bc1011 TaxID=3093725 RepID=UPI0039B057D0